MYTEIVPVSGNDLEYVKPYIVMVLRSMNYSLPSYVDQEDVVQDVLFKFWRLSLQYNIAYPKAYLWYIVQSVVVSLLRKEKLTVLTAYTDEGELLYGEVLITKSADMYDPASMLERKLDYVLFYSLLADAVLRLSPVQRTAMICDLREKVDYNQLLWAFRQRNVDISDVHWPIEKEAKQRLQASCCYARKKVAQQLRAYLCCA